MQEILEVINLLTKKDLDNKTISELILSAAEEFGEFCREVKIEDRVFGNSHKMAGDDGSKGEAIDMIVMAICLYFARGGTIQELPESLRIKVNKWKENQK